MYLPSSYCTELFLQMIDFSMTDFMIEEQGRDNIRQSNQIGLGKQIRSFRGKTLEQLRVKYALALRKQRVRYQ